MTGIAYTALLEEAEREYPSFPIQFPDGTEIRLRSSLDLNDEETQELSGIQTKLGELDESSNVSALRAEFVRALVLVSDNPEAAQAKLGEAPLKVLVVLFKKYSEGLGGAAKSEGSSPDPS